jgi:hypothetical protein
MNVEDKIEDVAVDDLRQVDRYITPDGTVVHNAPDGLEEDGKGRLYLNKKAVNVENDGRLTPAEALAHAATPKASDVMQRRVSMYVVEPDHKVLNVDRKAVLSQASDGRIFSNGSSVEDSRVVPIVEVDNKMFLAKQEIEIIEGNAVPVVDKLHVAMANAADEMLQPKVNHIKSKSEGMNIHAGANPFSSFIENFLQNYRIAKKAKGIQTNITDIKDLIDWDEAKSMGLSKELLQKGGNLEKMLQGKKTDLLPIAITDPDSKITINTYAKLSLKQDAEGKVHFRTNLLRNDLDLTQYCGHRLTDEDRASLSRTGNLGRTIEVKFKGDAAPKKILLSLDKQTNELIAFDAEKVQIPTQIAGKELSPKQQQDLKEGKSVKIEGMKSANGSEFTNTLQFSALEKRFVFTGEVPKINRHMAGVDLTDEQHSKLTSGETVQIIGMTDKAGKKYNAYARWNYDEKKLNFSSNPNFKRKAIPTNEHKTQVAANNEGHKPKALENVKGPVERKQPNTPSTSQSKKATVAPAKKYVRKGMKM